MEDVRVGGRKDGCEMQASFLHVSITPTCVRFAPEKKIQCKKENWIVDWMEWHKYNLLSIFYGGTQDGKITFDFLQ